MNSNFKCMIEAYVSALEFESFNVAMKKFSKQLMNQHNVDSLHLSPSDVRRFNSIRKKLEKSFERESLDVGYE